MTAIFKKEFSSYFKSPLAWVYIAVMQLLFGIFFVAYCMFNGMSEYGSMVLYNSSTFLFYLLPLLTMRSLSEESKNRTDQMLRTAPIGTWDIVLGKYLAALGVVVVSLAITFLQPLALVVFNNAVVDWEMTLCGYLGIFLLSCILLAVGLYISSLTDSQLVAAVATVALFIMMTLLNGIETALPTEALFSFIMILVLVAAVLFLIYRSVKDWKVTLAVGVVLFLAAVLLYILYPAAYEGLTATILSWINPMTRYWAVYDGIINLSTVVFFFAFAFFALFLTHQRLEKKRWN